MSIRKNRILFLLFSFSILFSLLIIDGSGSYAGVDHIRITVYYTTQVPTIALNSPLNNANQTNTTINVSITGSDFINLTKLEFWSNTTGSWLVNQTNSTPINNTAWNFTQTLVDGRYLIGACSYNNYSQSNCSTNNSLIIDRTGPAITLPFYANLTQKANTSTLSLNVLVRDLLSTTTGSICQININGTNQSVAVSNDWCNLSGGWLTGLTSGNYQIQVWANDSLGNIGLNNSYFVNIPIGKPAITINTPVGVQSSTNVSFNFSISSAGTLSVCTYNVTTTPGVIVVPQKTINCSNAIDYQSIGDTLGATDIVNVFANDTLGNSNTFNATFSVSIAAPSSSGGAGSSTIIINQTQTQTTQNTGPGTCKPFTDVLDNIQTQYSSMGFIDFLIKFWHEILDVAFCKSAASVYPIDF